ncbi:hypothetical protein BMF94_4251 [Rhodotorula taiwanensis]|uniref:DUF292-domain-containing protein n=1 Tax=Rhodotorula taiwanensis TaxID=741276 RepID=A0A2S5B6Q2_9BASI|nr:hypothetical protein BMF94_4251 [Rhodotorula taiwanensis]
MPPPAAWQPARARVQLKLSRERLRLLQQKKTQMAKQTRREVAALLDKGKLESARIKVEGLLAEDLYVELLEVLELYCELLLARFGLLETVKEIDPGVQEAVAGIIHAAPRTELREIHILREMLMSKGGRDFAVACIDNSDGVVPDRITSKLVIQTPPTDLVDLYLFEIAKAYSVDWVPESLATAATPTAPEGTIPAATDLSESNASGPKQNNGDGSARVPLASPTKTHAIPPFDTVLPETPPVDPARANGATIIRTNLGADEAKSAVAKSTAVAAPAAAVAPAASQPAKSAPAAAEKEDDAFEALQRRFAELKRK